MWNNIPWFVTKRIVVRRKTRKIKIWILYDEYDKPICRFFGESQTNVYSLHELYFFKIKKQTIIPIKYGKQRRNKNYFVTTKQFL